MAADGSARAHGALLPLRVGQPSSARRTIPSIPSPPKGPSMSSDVLLPGPSTDERLAELLRRNRRRSTALFAVVAFNVWVWGTRIYNFFTTGEERTLAFTLVHLALSFAALAVTGVVAAIAWRMRRDSFDGPAA